MVKRMPNLPSEQSDESPLYGVTISSIDNITMILLLFGEEEVMTPLA